MPDCQLRPATADDAPIVYALICELKQAEFDHQAFHAGYLANLQDHNMRYQLAELDGQIIGMIGLHMQFHLHHARWIGEIRGTGGDAAGARIKSGQPAAGSGRGRRTAGRRRADRAFHQREARGRAPFLCS